MMERKLVKLAILPIICWQIQDASALQSSSPAVVCSTIPHHSVVSSFAGAKKERSTCLLVYSPEKDEDNQLETDSVGDKVLESLIEKLDKSSSDADTAAAARAKKENKAMAFLRKMGKVGGAANKDVTNAVGSDEGAGMTAPKQNTDSGSSSPSPVRKSLTAYIDATESGIIDDLSDPSFPMTSSGTEWRGVSDRVKGGTSEGSIKRDVIDDVTCNVLLGHVTADEESPFIQMVTELSKDPSKESVDASEYDGIELDVLSKEGLSFNVHLRTSRNLKENSFRTTVNLECLFGWSTMRIPFSSFKDQDGTSVDYSKIKRIGIVALEPDTDVHLAIGGVRFYNVI